MTYAKMLSAIISESDLSLRQIAKRCSDQNLSITPSYISQLKNGKLPPPSEDVSLVLAKVCGAKNPAYLVFQGYMEKAPEVVKEYMLASSALNKIMLESLCKSNDGSISPEFKTYIENLDVLASLEMSSKYITLEDTSKAHDLIKEITLACGGVTEADTKGDIINFFLGDSSMSPQIPVHSYVYIIPTRIDLLKDKDIIAFYPDNRNIPTLRRMCIIRDKIILIPEDKSFQAYYFEDMSAINYIGKVVSYKVDL